MIMLLSFWKDVLTSVNFKSRLVTSGVDLAGKTLKIALVLVLAFFVLRGGRLLIARLFTPRDNRKTFLESRRAQALNSLLQSILTYGIYFMTALIILQEILDKSLTPVLAGAGIVGLAVGFGAQSLVRDVITGFFILLEDQFTVGDYIKIAGMSGLVEEMGLRVTRLRDWGGELHIIPNGQIKEITNFSRGPMRALVDVGIAHDADLDQALQILQQVATDVGAGNELITEGPTVLGVVDLNETATVLRVVAHTAPLLQWEVERDLRRRIKLAFDQAGIRLTTPAGLLAGFLQPNRPRKENQDE